MRKELFFVSLDGEREKRRDSERKRQMPPRVPEVAGRGKSGKSNYLPGEKGPNPELRQKLSSYFHFILSFRPLRSSPHDSRRRLSLSISSLDGTHLGGTEQRKYMATTCPVEIVGENATYDRDSKPSGFSGLLTNPRAVET